MMEFFLQILLGSKVSLQIDKRIELLIEFRATNLPQKVTEVSVTDTDRQWFRLVDLTNVDQFWWEKHLY